MRLNGWFIQPTTDSLAKMRSTYAAYELGIPEVKKILRECRSLIMNSVLDNIGDSLLLSGGLDTSIIAHLASQRKRPTCFTVVFPYGRSPDLYYARSVVRKLDLRWKVVRLLTTNLQDRLTHVIRILKTFDPMEVRNSVAVFEGIRTVLLDGLSKVMTGDGTDELFAGYSFIYNLKPHEMMKGLKELWKVMRFSSRPMAEALGVGVSLPYLDSRVVAFAKELSPEHLVGYNRGRKYGKYILRVSFEDLLGRRITWRVKTPIEYGSGTTSLTKYYSERIKEEEFLQEKRKIAERDGVRIRDKEHLEYYRLFRGIFPPPRYVSSTRSVCPDCGADVGENSRFCTTCGAYPIRASSIE